MGSVRTGLDKLVEDQFSRISGRAVALLANPASVSRDLEPATNLFFRKAKSGSFVLKAFFGPQHGFYGDTQENMIEWEDFIDPDSGLPIFSLYGSTRKPSAEMLDGVDLLICDLPDIGARYYTYLWTMVLCMKVCADLGIEMLILDRPNPLGGLEIQGPPLDAEFCSFVGLYPLPVRHGMTIGELALYFKDRYFPDSEIEVLRVDGWNRSMMHSKTELRWVIPSPNMPTYETALVYPGQCLLEGTDLSEGRGTTRPFLLCGAPFINPEILVNGLAEFSRKKLLPGASFRQVHFRPTFHKHQGCVCGGVEIYPDNPESFRPLSVTTAILLTIFKHWPGKANWRPPPYEYEMDRLPFDILSGSERLRKQIESGLDLEEIVEGWLEGNRCFENERRPYLLYD